MWPDLLETCYTEVRLTDDRHRSSDIRLCEDVCLLSKHTLSRQIVTARNRDHIFGTINLKGFMHIYGSNIQALVGLVRIQSLIQLVSKRSTTIGRGYKTHGRMGQIGCRYHESRSLNTVSSCSRHQDFLMWS